MRLVLTCLILLITSGSVVGQPASTPPGEDVFAEFTAALVEVLPEYPGGQGQLIKAINTSSSPAPAKSGGSKVKVKFIVDEAGQVSSPVVLSASGCPSCDDAVLTALTHLPKKFIPATHGGKPCRYPVTLVIRTRGK